MSEFVLVRQDGMPIEQRGVGNGTMRDFETALAALLAELCIIMPEPVAVHEGSSYESNQSQPARQ